MRQPTVCNETTTDTKKVTASRVTSVEVTSEKRDTVEGVNVKHLASDTSVKPVRDRAVNTLGRGFARNSCEDQVKRSSCINTVEKLRKRCFRYAWSLQ